MNSQEPVKPCEHLWSETGQCQFCGVLRFEEVRKFDQELLKPCPFCGVDFNDLLVQETRDMRLGMSHHCRTHLNITCDYPHAGEKAWQDTYCWKQLDQMRSERDEARKALELCREVQNAQSDTLEISGKDLESQSAQIEKLKEGMGELVKAVEKACNDLGAPTMDYEPVIAVREHRKMRDAVAQKLIKALASARKVGM